MARGDPRFGAPRPEASGSLAIRGWDQLPIRDRGVYRDLGKGEGLVRLLRNATTNER
jgi:hypothetical protein